MVLLAVINVNYEFITAEFGVIGRISNGDVNQQTMFYRKLNDNALHYIEKRTGAEESSKLKTGMQAISNFDRVG